MSIFYSLAAVFMVSLISLVGVFTFSTSEKSIKKYLLFLVAFAVGVLFGDVFLHLLPEAYEQFGLENNISLLILFGILSFFSIEKFVRWHHCHDVDCEEHKTLGIMNLVGDGLHNFLDGALIAGSFLISLPLGITTTLAIALHEIPQEIGDFSVLMHSGYSRGKALRFNFLSALFAFAGAGLVILLGSRVSNLEFYLIPITIGGFLYIAGSDLVPELHKETRLPEGINQLVGLILGILLMWVMV